RVRGRQNGSGRPTHAVRAFTGVAVCGVETNTLQVLDEDGEAACFIEKCPACFDAVTVHH
ncbi:MAG TPA: hypothetical protein VJ966_05620, partial [Actinomycetes bacterium]|nr:hypothetical protein [Actinomycetes bacterium]